MFWFDPNDPRALFIDKRQEIHAMDLGTESTKGRAPAVIAPDIVADFGAMPFPDESFHLVVFDPPHILRHRGGLTGCFSKKYGMLPDAVDACACCEVRILRLIAGRFHLGVVQLTHGDLRDAQVVSNSRAFSKLTRNPDAFR